MKERTRFLATFGVFALVAVWANAEVLLRSGQVLNCAGTSGTTNFQCARWRTIGLFVTVVTLLYPMAYVIDMETARDVFGS